MVLKLVSSFSCSLVTIRISFFMYKILNLNENKIYLKFIFTILLLSDIGLNPTISVQNKIDYIGDEIYLNLQKEAFIDLWQDASTDSESVFNSLLKVDVLLMNNFK